jgi:hypothetical protein
MSAVPTIELNDGQTIPQLGPGSSRSIPRRPPRPSATIRGNLELFDFQLESDDIERIALDQGEAGRTGPHPDSFAYLPG